MSMGGLAFTTATNFAVKLHYHQHTPPPSLPLLHSLKLYNPKFHNSSISLSLATARASHSNNELQALDISTLRSTSVRLIDGNHNMVGIVSKSQARQMAQDAELDLVIVSPDADPPVVKMIDYSKYRYELQKKKKGQQKKSAASQMDLKELKMGYNIDQHDYSVRLKAARKFLKDGDKVKVTVNLKGRENEFRNIAIELVKRFQSDVGELATEQTKSFRDRNIFIVMAPNKAALQKAQEPPKNKDKSAAD
ncbi:translation initiation factor IF3-2, chloroplastic-like [Abrus precatorius]|uniref:Translation initiation factor IF-3 n=1 Tax=Abrus precatorius TaxID=3816 RepID=A0A8B8LQ80_ABRPR|nr:translation initiation factor IF3-2, chloroplastic-like [Abrus precatorius]